MSRLFAYIRVSTVEQNTENQEIEIRNAGFDVRENRIIKEKIAGSIPIAQRPQFIRLLDRLEEGDSLIVTKLDRLGRDAIDVSNMLETLAKNKIKVHCLALGTMDLNSPVGKVTAGVINLIAQFERDILIERTQAGLQRAIANGKTLGRKRVLSKAKTQQVKELVKDGVSISEIARRFNTSRPTIARARDS